MTQFASQYLALNILLVIAFAVCFALYCANQKFHFIKSKQELKFNYLLITMVIALAIGQGFLPKQEFFKPPAKVWSASSSKAFNHDFSLSEPRGYLSLDFIPSAPLVSTNLLNLFFWLSSFAALFFGLYRLIRDLTALRKITSQSFIIREIKSVRIFSSDIIAVPFSFWTPNRHVVVVPNKMLGAREDVKIAILHELQHHRQKDTYWVHLLWALRVVCCWNPAIYFWNKLFLEVQEFACDEALVDQNKVASQAYAGCLLRVASTAVSQEQNFVCATGLTFMADRHSLTRRISTMFNTKRKTLSRGFATGLAILMVGGLTCIAMASQGLIQDRRVTMKDAKDMLSHVKTNDDFPVVVNDLVLKQLNRYIGTQEGRDFMRKSLQRMETYRPSVEKKLAEYGLPPEFLAVPITESGYQNLSESPTGAHSAGIWQFIPSTARNYGLRVDSSVDERMNAATLTDAAMRYLLSNKSRFKSAELSILAFNAGEARVQEGINKVGSRDMWTLIKSGYEGDADYIPKLMAAILIMENPTSVQ